MEINCDGISSVLGGFGLCYHINDLPFPGTEKRPEERKLTEVGLKDTLTNSEENVRSFLSGKTSFKTSRMC